VHHTAVSVGDARRSACAVAQSSALDPDAPRSSPGERLRMDDRVARMKNTSSKPRSALRSIVLGLLASASIATLLAAGTARASGDDPVPEPTKSPGHHASASAEHLVNEGIALAKQANWVGAEQKYRAAIAVKQDIPEAWNGLGHALKMQRHYDDALAAYQEALRLRPVYPQAIEYLGETYAEMGRIGEANQQLAHLRRLDGKLAEQLASAITNKTTHASSW
jgi:tetratricopeptide (TPR) repeat protein